MNFLNRFALFAFGAIALIIVSTGCSEKSKAPEPIGTLKTYTDTITNFKVQYPSNWTLIQKEAGRRFMIFPSKEANEAFKKVYAAPAEINNSAAQIAVFLQPIRGRTLDTIVLDNMSDMISDSLFTEKNQSLLMVFQVIVYIIAIIWPMDYMRVKSILVLKILPMQQ